MEGAVVSSSYLRSEEVLRVLAATPSPSNSPLASSTGTSAEPWYDSDAFIVSAVLVGVFLIVGAGLKFWWMSQANKAATSGREFESGNLSGGFSKGTGGRADSDRTNSYEYAESASLLGNGSGRNALTANSSSSASAAPPLGGTKKPAASFSVAIEVPKFAVEDLQDCEEATLMKKFTTIMAAGVVISLHTTKGPKPVLLSLVGDEVRWQAVKTAQKRYKLNLKDVTYVTAGKTTSNFSRARMADDRLCFSLLTNKTTLDLEASSTLERDCLWRGFKVAVERVKFVSA